MVAAIKICICDRDGRRPSSTPAHFEAPDALGSGERGGRILMPAEFQFCTLAAAKNSSHLFSTNQMLLAGNPANSIHSLWELSRAYYVFQWQWISLWLEMEPPDAERIAVGSRDHSLISSLKELESRRNLISQSAHPGVP